MYCRVPLFCALPVRSATKRLYISCTVSIKDQSLPRSSQCTVIVPSVILQDYHRLSQRPPTTCWSRRVCAVDMAAGELGVDLPVGLDILSVPMPLTVMETPAHICLVFPINESVPGPFSYRRGLPPWMMSTRVRLPAQCGSQHRQRRRVHGDESTAKEKSTATTRSRIFISTSFLFLPTFRPSPPPKENQQDNPHSN